MKEEERREEIYRGHLDECFRHLVGSLNVQFPRGSKGASAARRPIADFCGVTTATVTTWAFSNVLPIGMPWIRLVCFLDLQGYRVIELERMPKAHRNFFELLGYGLISIVEAARRLGYASTSTLYEVLRGQHGSGQDKNEKMWELWKERRDALATAKERARGKFRLKSPEVSSPSLALASPMNSTQRVSSPSPAHPGAVIHLMSGLLELLEAGALNGFADSEADQLSKSDRSVVLRLSARLGTLSSSLIMGSERKGGFSG